MRLSFPTLFVRALIASVLVSFAVLAQSAKAPPPAEAAPSPKIEEEITVLGHPEKIVREFVETFDVPTAVTGQIARWKDPVCPETHGLEPAFEKFITARVKAVAAMIGAGPKPDDHCRINTRIIITPAPQLFMNKLAAKSPNYLGFHFAAQTKEVATVRHPIQAWYATQTEDINGHVIPDMPDACDVMQYGKYRGDTCFTLNGSRIRLGWRTEFAQVTVVVDYTKIADLEIGQLADYVAMLALSQTKSFDTCRALPSIANLMTKDCDAGKKATGLTSYDIAYLRALYTMDPLAAAGLGGNDLVHWMMKDLQQPR